MNKQNTRTKLRGFSEIEINQIIRRERNINVEFHTNLEGRLYKSKPFVLVQDSGTGIHWDRLIKSNTSEALKDIAYVVLNNSDAHVSCGMLSACIGFINNYNCLKPLPKDQVERIFLEAVSNSIKGISRKTKIGLWHEADCDRIYVSGFDDSRSMTDILDMNSTILKLKKEGDSVTQQRVLDESDIQKLCIVKKHWNLFSDEIKRYNKA